MKNCFEGNSLFAKNSVNYTVGENTSVASHSNDVYSGLSVVYRLNYNGSSTKPQVIAVEDVADGIQTWGQTHGMSAGQLWDVSGVKWYFCRPFINWDSLIWNQTNLVPELSKAKQINSAKFTRKFTGS